MFDIKNMFYNEYDVKLGLISLDKQTLEKQTTPHNGNIQYQTDVK